MGGQAVMKLVSRILASASLISICVVVGTAARAGDGQGRGSQSNRDAVNPFTSDLPKIAPNTEPVLQNAWGVAFTPGASPFWISDNATGCSTLYDGAGIPQPTSPKPLQVAIPLPGGTVPPTACHMVNPNASPPPTNAAPTGMAWNPTTTFLVPGTSIAAAFIWATEDGTISAWAGGLGNLTPPLPANNAVLAFTSETAVYKGLVFGTNANGVFLFATNFHDGTVDVLAANGSKGFRLATKKEVDGDFSDPNIPAGFAPFGIENIDGDLFVSYAKQDAEKHDDVAGRGNGFVDLFDTDGHVLRRFASRGPLNSPWGMTRASFAFGRFSGDILVGNFGNGKINVFSTQGRFIDELDLPNGKPLV